MNWESRKIQISDSWENTHSELSWIMLGYLSMGRTNITFADLLPIFIGGPMGSPVDVVLGSLQCKSCGKSLCMEQKSGSLQVHQVGPTPRK